MAHISVYQTAATYGYFNVSVFSLASNVASRLVAFVKSEIKASRTLNQLSALSTTELADIGLDRGDIKNVAYGK